MIKYLVMSQPKENKEKLWPDTKLYTEDEAKSVVEKRQEVWGEDVNHFMVPVDFSEYVK